MCSYECCISAKSIHSSLISWPGRYLKKIKDQNQDSQNRRSGKKSHHIYETYNNIVMPHGQHIYAKATDTEQATMCAYPYSDHALIHWKCILWCCSDCTFINLPYQ